MLRVKESTMPRRASPVFLAISLLLTIGNRAAAVAPQIKDEAKFFSADAVKKADKQIRDIERKYGKDLLIETLPAVPGDQAAKVKAMATEEREKFFHNWAADRAEAAVVNGVYVLVVKEPPHLEIEITAKARSIFPKEEFDRLRSLLLGKFRNKQFDEGLLEAVRFVDERFAASQSK
jgi:uncharacterized membrane protein YgcG